MYIVFPKFRAFRGFGVNNAEITKISSEQNKIISTLFQISSEQKIFCSELFNLILGVFFRASKLLVIADE